MRDDEARGDNEEQQINLCGAVFKENSIRRFSKVVPVRQIEVAEDAVKHERYRRHEIMVFVSGGRFESIEGVGHQTAGRHYDDHLIEHWTGILR